MLEAIWPEEVCDDAQLHRVSRVSASSLPAHIKHWGYSRGGYYYYSVVFLNSDITTQHKSIKDLC